MVSKFERKFSKELIAPCGMNCGICKAYLAYSRDAYRKRFKTVHCMGCRSRNKMCFYVRKHCAKIRNNKIKFCFECEGFPCDRIKTLDKRYRTRYGMSMVENLKEIKEKGMEKFLKKQREKYKCSECGDVVSVHNGMCYSCGFTRTAA
jgi:hypothetical protein